MKFLSLFSGIGGIDLGLERAGMTCIGQVEIEPFPRAVLAKHWPDVFRWSDICDLPTELVRYAVGRPDLIAGGFACQDVSAAGKGAGIGRQTRSGLTWRNLFRLARGLRPDWLLIENVPALRTRGADRVIPALERIGYACWPLVVGAWSVGAPHKRDRVWIVGRLANAPGPRLSSPRNAHERELRSVVAAASGEELADAECGGLSRGSVEGIMGIACGRLRPAGHSQASGIARRGVLADAERSGRGRREGREDRRERNGEDAGRVEGDHQSAGADSHGLAGCIFPGGCSRCADRSYNELADTSSPGLEGQGDRAFNVAEEISVPSSTLPHGTRWPSRPGEPQHAWEAPRLVEFPVGGELDGLPVRLARFANRHGLKACGNSVVPQVVEAIGREIVRLDEEMKAVTDAA